MTAGDWVVLSDSQNRVLVYSLQTARQIGRFFGEYAAVSLENDLLCIENEIGKLAVYYLKTGEKRDEFVFSNPISMLRFIDKGNRLFVLTSNQFAYVLDVSALSRPLGH